MKHSNSWFTKIPKYSQVYGTSSLIRAQAYGLGILQGSFLGFLGPFNPLTYLFYSI